MLSLRILFIIYYAKNCFEQLFFISYIHYIKITQTSYKYSIDNVLNDLLRDFSKEIDQQLAKGQFKYTKNHIMYRLHTTKNNKYNNKKILFIGGRNSIVVNNRFGDLLSRNLDIDVITFQYDGYYKSGYSSHLSYKSYLHTIDEIYNTFSSNQIYIIGYSLGCYGALYKNTRKNVLLISPFYSLQESVRNFIRIDEFNINDLLKSIHSKVTIFSFYGDIINPPSLLKNEFERDNVTVIKKHGVHVSGLSDILLEDIQKYIEEDY